jgi:hypothetical protein
MMGGHAVRSGGSLSVVVHRNKLLKGALVRFLLDDPACGPDELADWRHPMGFRYEPALDEVPGERPCSRSCCGGDPRARSPPGASDGHEAEREREPRAADRDRRHERRPRR